jgi:hypothetical protein
MMDVARETFGGRAELEVDALAADGDPAVSREQGAEEAREERLTQLEDRCRHELLR